MHAVLINMCQRWKVTGTQREEYGYSKFSNSKNLPCVTCSAKHQCVKEYNSQNPRKHEDHQHEVRLKGPFFTQPSVNHEDPSAPRRSPSNPAGSGDLVLLNQPSDALWARSRLLTTSALGSCTVPSTRSRTGCSPPPPR